MDLNLQLTINRLGPDYSGTGKPYYSLVLTAGFGDEASVTDDSTAAYLQPWNWTLGSMVVKNAKDSSSLTPTGTARTEFKNLDLLKKRLTRELVSYQAAAIKQNFVLPAVDQPQKVTISGNSLKSDRKWHAFLSHTATLPDGVATALNLAAFFWLDQEPAQDAILLAAPVLTIGSVTYTPGQYALSNGAYVWQYTSSLASDPVAVKAGLMPASPLPGSVGDSIIDLRKLLPAQMIVKDSDWQRQLAEALTPAFDGPQLILGFCRSKTITEAAIKAAAPPLAAAITSELKGTLDPKRKSPDGHSIRESVLLAVASRLKIQYPFNSGQVNYNIATPDIASLSGIPRLQEALERAWNQLAAPDQFAQKLVELWQVAYPQVFTDHPDFRQALLDELAGRQAHSQLVMEEVGARWTKIVPTDKPSKPKEEVADLFQTVLAQAQDFAASIWNGGPLADVAKDVVCCVFLTKADNPVPQPPAQLSTDSSAEGITVQVDSLAALPVTGDADDFHRLLSGALLFIRRTAPASGAAADWRCANLVSLAWLDENHEQILLQNSDGTASFVGVAPSRFQYSQGMRNAFLTYNGHPLVAQSPWSRFSQQPATYISANGDPLGQLGSVIDYLNPYRKSGDKLERLAYSTAQDSYDIALAYVGTAGNLPAEAAAAASPATFRMPGPQELTPTKVPFRRTAPVGGLRVEPLTRSAADAFPPPIPDGVVPRHQPLDKDDGNTVYQPEHHPLVLLIPPAPASAAIDPWLRATNRLPSTTAFSLFPPTVDVKVWDRWQPDTSNLEQVLIDYHQLLEDQKQGLRLLEVPYPDDPAVAGFTISLARPDGSGTPPPPISDSFQPSAATYPGLAKFQRPPVKVTISSVIGQPTLTGTAKLGIAVGIPAGEIWQLDVQPVYTGQDRFKTPPDPVAAMVSITVEVARPLFTSDTERTELCSELFGSLKATFDSTNVLTLKADAIGKPFQLDLNKVEVSVQQWLWDGRPLYEADTDGRLCIPRRSGFPFYSIGAWSKSDFPADGMLFGTRRDSDAVIHSTFVNYSGATKTQVFSRDLTSLQGAQYFRFAVRAFSRYAPLLRSDHFLDSSIPSDLKSPKRWVRHVVPCRYNQLVPKPAIQLILPITESLTALDAAGGADPAGSYPGFLVALQESWYDPKTAGMAQFLESEIIQVAFPDNPDERRYQFGPDPLIDMSDDPYGDFTINLPRPEGPIGSTFDDSGSPAPEFTKCSFFQAAPTFPSLPEVDSSHPSNDLSFHFLKIRFRRVIVLGGRECDCPASPPAPGNTYEVRQRIQSDWSDAHWAQVLPAANRWRCQFFEWDAAHKPAWGDVQWLNLTALAPTKMPLAWSLTDRSFKWNGRLVYPLCTARAPIAAGSDGAAPTDARFSLFLIVSRVVTDVFGSHDQESFETLFPLNSPASISWNAEWRPHLVRIAEVQHRGALDISGDDVMAKFTEALFPSRKLYAGWTMDQAANTIDNSADAKARIVRISPPVPVQP